MYKIYFMDGSSFKGGKPQDSKWNLIPNKPIIKLEYKIASHIITLEGYEAYNHIVERTFIYGRGQYISMIILMAKIGNDIFGMEFNSMTGKIIPRLAVWGKEWRGKAHTGWKMGTKGTQPKSSID